MRIRMALRSDAEEIARLSSQLGYPAEPSRIEERLRPILNRDDHIVCVVESGQQLAGWIHAHVRYVVESPPFVEIGGLVVDRAHRGMGIGKRLVEACERWAARSGFVKIRVRTNQAREDAVHFYSRIGFAPAKSQHVLDKELR